VPCFLAFYPSFNGVTTSYTRGKYGWLCCLAGKRIQIQRINTTVPFLIFLPYNPILPLRKHRRRLAVPGRYTFHPNLFPEWWLKIIIAPSGLNTLKKSAW
jgi:hypothetical protein